jgi:dihydropyrimidinase
VVDATGRWVLPGGVDVHTHFALPFGGSVSADDFETGTRAAAFGGTTCVVDFAVQDKGQPLRKAWETWMAKAEGKASIDYGFHMILREFNADVSREMGEMAGEGVTSFKLFTAYPGVFMLDDASIFLALQRSTEIGATISVHAENGGVIDALVKQAVARGQLAPRYHALTRPARAEAEATNRALALAEIAGAPLYVVHLTAAESLDVVRSARARGVDVVAETCPQYLYLSHDNYEEPGFDGAKYVMSPPLRDSARQEELWRGLANRELSVVATDHCPFNLKGQKDMGRDDFTKIPNGLPVVENRMGLIYDGGVVRGRFSVHRWIEACCTFPAKMFGLFPRKGTIAPGSDADILVFDPEAEQTISAKTHHMNVDYSAFEGMKIKGVFETVLSRGRVIVERGQYHAKPGSGRYLKRGARVS